MGLIDTAVIVELAQALGSMVVLIAGLWACAWLLIFGVPFAWQWFQGRAR